MSADPLTVEYLRCVKEHPSIEVVVEEEGEEDGVMVTTDALMVTSVSVGG